MRYEASGDTLYSRANRSTGRDCQALVDAYRIKNAQTGRQLTQEQFAVLGKITAELTNKAEGLTQNPSACVVYGEITASHIHHSRIHRISGNQAIHVFQTSRFSKITNCHSSEILSIIFEHHSDLAFNGFRYETVKVGQVAENRTVADELFSLAGRYSAE